MKKAFTFTLVLALFLVALPVSAQEEVVELVMGSWRTEDIEQWDEILAAFNAAYPNIVVRFEPTLNTEYDAQLRAALEAGTGPDLITCRPFDLSLGLYEAGYLASVNDLPGMEHFNDVARSGWITDDGENVYCVPMASVIHGFIYNADLFEEHGWTAPATMDEFMALLQTILDAGITPLAMGTKDGWGNAYMGFENIGPNYWDGEVGRQALISGEAKFTDPEFVAAIEAVVAWEPYLPDGHEAIGYADTQQLFPLGGAAIFPAGSWEIPIFEANAMFAMHAFKPPVVDPDAETCWINDHVDIAVGMNAATAHPEEARIFLEWLTTQEFAQMYSNLQPGFFSLSDHQLTLENPLAQEFLDWRQECQGTIRVLYQYLSRGEVSADNENWRIMPAVIQGVMTPMEAAEELESYLWRPGQ